MNGIDIERMVDRRKEQLEMLNRISIDALVTANKYAGTEYEINDGKIVAEVLA